MWNEFPLHLVWHDWAWLHRGGEWVVWHCVHLHHQPLGSPATRECACARSLNWCLTPGSADDGSIKGLAARQISAGKEASALAGSVPGSLDRNPPIAWTRGDGGHFECAWQLGRTVSPLHQSTSLLVLQWASSTLIEVTHPNYHHSYNNCHRSALHDNRWDELHAQ